MYNILSLKFLSYHNYFYIAKQMAMTTLHQLYGWGTVSLSFYYYYCPVNCVNTILQTLDNKNTLITEWFYLGYHYYINIILQDTLSPVSLSLSLPKVPPHMVINLPTLYTVYVTNQFFSPVKKLLVVLQAGDFDWEVEIPHTVHWRWWDDVQYVWHCVVEACST